jgi:hypothetical protein
LPTDACCPTNARAQSNRPLNWVATYNEIPQRHRRPKEQQNPRLILVSRSPRVTERTGGPGVEMTTRADAARVVRLLRSWRQTSPHWDYAAELLLESGGDQKADRHRSGHDPDATRRATRPMAMRCRRRPEPTVLARSCRFARGYVWRQQAKRFGAFATHYGRCCSAPPPPDYYKATDDRCLNLGRQLEMVYPPVG